MSAFHHRFVLCTLGILALMLTLPGTGFAQSGCRQQCIREAVKCVQYENSAPGTTRRAGACRTSRSACSRGRSASSSRGSAPSTRRPAPRRGTPAAPSSSFRRSNGARGILTGAESHRHPAETRSGIRRRNRAAPGTGRKAQEGVPRKGDALFDEAVRFTR